MLQKVHMLINLFPYLVRCVGISNQNSMIRILIGLPYLHHKPSSLYNQCTGVGLSHNHPKHKENVIPSENWSLISIIEFFKKYIANFIKTFSTIQKGLFSFEIE